MDTGANRSEEKTSKEKEFDEEKMVYGILHQNDDKMCEDDLVKTESNNLDTKANHTEEKTFIEKEFDKEKMVYETLHQNDDKMCEDDLLKTDCVGKSCI